MYIDITTLDYPLTLDMVRQRCPNMSIPSDVLEIPGFAAVSPAPQPVPATENKVIEGAPTETAPGVWQQQWLEVPLTQAEIDMAAQQIISRLWQAAHDYEYAQISGSAIGLLAMGVVRGAPKCVAVQNWIKSIWTEYYTRKAALAQDYDYSIVGACPHTVPELMIELGV